MRRVLVVAVALALSGLFLAGCAVSNTDQLTATTWYLVSGTEKNPAWQWTVPTDAQDRYTIRFEKDGTFSSRADCNQLAGSWTASGSDRITITSGPMTMAFCGKPSFDVLYAGLLVAPDGTSIVLTLPEWQFLGLLAASAGRPVTRDSLVAGLGGDEQGMDAHRLDMLVYRLRRKCAESTSTPLPLRAVRGIGYVLTW